MVPQTQMDASSTEHLKVPDVEVKLKYAIVALSKQLDVSLAKLLQILYDA